MLKGKKWSRRISLILAVIMMCTTLLDGVFNISFADGVKNTNEVFQDKGEEYEKGNKEEKSSGKIGETSSEEEKESYKEKQDSNSKEEESADSKKNSEEKEKSGEEDLSEVGDVLKGIYPEVMNKKMKRILEEGEIEVSNWEDFKLAYNNNTDIKLIRLKDDIVAEKGSLNSRTSPLIISGLKGNPKTKDDYYLLSLEGNTLNIGSPNKDFQQLKLENLKIANENGSHFIDGGNSNKWTLHFHNLKSVESNKNGKSLMRLAQAHRSKLIFEGNIDIKTRAEFAEPGAVLIKEGTVFKGHQVNETGSLPYSAFWYHSTLDASERTFVVENNAKIDWTRDKTSNYPPVYHYYSSMKVGNNVEWTQNNYKHFISNAGDTTTEKEIKFGSRNKIEAKNSTNESIDFGGSKENKIEFGPGSSLVIEGQGSILNIGRNTSLVFRNPVGLDLETRGSSTKLFSLTSPSNVEFQYVTMNVWDEPRDSSGDLKLKPDESFRKVKSAVASKSATKSVDMVSDSSDLVDWFKTSNPRRLTTEKVPVGDIKINYINHKNGESVGEYIIGSNELYLEFGESSDYEFLVDEELDLTENISKNKVPAGYSFATKDQLTAGGNKYSQPEFVKTGMKKEAGDEGKDIEDPRVTNVYVHPEGVDFNVRYVYVGDDRVLKTEKFSSEVGDRVDLSTSPYIDKIYDGFKYAKESELKENQKQDGLVTIKKGATYTIYISRTSDKGGIWGRVIDRDSNLGIANALVKLPGINRQVVTDESGFYLMTDLEANSYTSLVSKEEYNSESDVLTVDIDMVYKDFYLDKKSKGEKFLIYGLVEVVDGSGIFPAKDARVNLLDGEGAKAVTDSFGIYAIAKVEGNRSYSIEASKTGFSSSKKTENIGNSDKEINFKLFSGYAIEIVGKAGNKELYRYAIETTKTSNKFKVKALPVNEYKLIGSNAGNLDSNNEVEVDPSVYEEGKDLIFNYEYNMAKIGVKAIYKDGDREVVIGEFEDKGEIGQKYKWKGTTPIIDGYLYNTMGDEILVKDKENLFKLYYIKSSGNLKINATEVLKDGSINIVGSTNREILKDETYNVKPDLAPSEIEILDLKYYDLGSGHYIGKNGITSFTYSGSGPIPEVNYIYNRKTSKLKIKAYDIKYNTELKLTDGERTVNRGENIEVKAPTLDDTIRDRYKLVGEDRQVVFFKYDETEKTLNFYYEMKEKEMLDVQVDLVFLEDGIEKQIVSYQVPGEKDKSLTVVAPEMKGWKIGESEKIKIITPTDASGNRVKFTYEKDIYTISLKLVTFENGVEKDLMTLLGDGIRDRYEVIKGQDYTIFAPQISGYSISELDKSFKEFKNVQKDEEAKFIYKPISEVVEDHVVKVSVVGKDDKGKELYRYEVNRPKNSGSFTVKAFEHGGYKLKEGEKTVEVGEKAETIEFDYVSLSTKVRVKAFYEDKGQKKYIGLDEFVPIEVRVNEGETFSYNAPYIPNWNLVGSSIGRIEKVSSEDNVLEFKYERAKGNIDIVLREKDGRIIKTESRIGEIGEEIKLVAPNLEADYYDLAESTEYPKEVNIVYGEDKKTVVFEYEKEERDILIRGFDTTGGKREEIDFNKLKHRGRIGEVVKISAPLVDNLRVVGDTNKSYEISTVDGQEVIFEYSSIREDEIVLEAVEVDGGNQPRKLLQNFIFETTKGTHLKVKAPIIESYTLIDGEVQEKIVDAGAKVRFNYVENTVNIKLELVDALGEIIATTTGVQLNYHVLKNTDTTIHAPHISGYVLSNSTQANYTFENIQKDEKVKFVYRPISDIVLDHTVDVMVKGVTENGRELYSYKLQRPKNSGKYEISAFSEPGYEIDGKAKEEITVNESDLFVTFKYKSLNRLVKIGAYYIENGIEYKIPETDYLPIEEVGIKGEAFVYSAPYIKDWKLKGDLKQEISQVGDENELKFFYDKASGNVEIILKEENGRVIKSIIKEVKHKEELVLDPNSGDFDLSSDNYTLVPNQDVKKIKYEDKLQTVVFEYTKDTREVEIEAYDITDSPSGTKIYLNLPKIVGRIGESIPISAPSIENKQLVGEVSRLYLIGDADNQKIRFNYKSTEDGKVTLEAVDVDGNVILQTTSIDVLEGTNLKLSAPNFGSYKLVAGEDQVKLAKAGEKVRFNYEKDTVNVELKFMDGSTEIQAPIGIESKFKVLRHSDQYIYAPHITGYVISGSGKEYVSNIEVDKLIVFNYKKIEEIVDSHMVSIDVIGMDKSGNQLYKYTIQRPKNYGKDTIRAFDQYGYGISNSEREKEINVGIENLRVEFIYNSVKRQVTVKAVDENGQKIPSYTEQRLDAVDGSPFTYNAPYIEGWNLLDEEVIGKIDSVSEMNSTISFKYEKAEGNVEIRLMEKMQDGSKRLIKTSSETVKIDEPIKVKAEDLSKSYYILEGRDEVDVSYKDELQIVEFYYTKGIRKVNIELYDVSNPGGNILIESVTTDDYYRIGEVSEIFAPKPNDGKYILVGDRSKLVVIEEDNKLSFNFRSLEEKNGIVRAIESGSNQVIQEFTLKLKEGEAIKVEAPKFDTHKLISSELSIKELRSGMTINFEYDKTVANIKVRAKDTSGKDLLLSPDIKSDFEVSLGRSIDIYAPHLAGYVLANKDKGVIRYEDVREDKLAEFIYKPISEVVEDHVISLRVKGIDEKGSEIYSYKLNLAKNSGEFTIDALTQSGYSLSGEVSKKVDVKDKDMDVVFEYENLDQPVIVKAQDELGNTPEGFSEIRLIGKKGSPFSYNAPYIKGWNLMDDSIKKIDNLSPSNNTLVFKYKKAEGNIEVVLKDVDGKIIKTISETVTIKDGDKLIQAPNLEAEFYQIQGKDEEIVSYKEDLQVVEFVYKKKERKTRIEAFDLTNNVIIKEEVAGSYGIGQVINFTSPLIDGYHLFENMDKLVYIEDGSDVQVIRFNYKSSKEDKIVINSVDKNTKEILQSSVVTVQDGIDMKIEAPKFETHKLAPGESDVKTGRAGETLVFYYERTTKKVIFTAESKGIELSLPVGTLSEFDVVRGKDISVYAPYIPGYVLKNKEDSVVELKKVEKDSLIKFEYLPIEEVVKEHLIEINIRGIDGKNQELYNYSIKEPKNSGLFTVKAMNQNGFEIVGDSKRDVIVKDVPIFVEFSYRSLGFNVVIKQVDEDGNNIGENIVKPAVKNQPFTFNAPYVEGWNLIGSSLATIESVDEGNNLIVFKYGKKKDNVSIVLKEDDGRIIKTLSDSISVGEEKTITVPDLSPDYYTALDGDKKIKYSGDNQVVEFKYRKNTREVIIERYDVSKSKEGSIIDSEKLKDSFRIGEVSEFKAKDLSGYYLLGDTSKLVVVTDGKDAQKVRFDYKSETDKDTKVVVKYISDRGDSLDNIVVNGESPGKRYTHKYPKKLTGRNGRVYDEVNYLTDTITVDSDVTNNIMIFIYSEGSKTGGGSGGRCSVDYSQDVTYTIKHIYKDDKGGEKDIIDPIKEKGRVGEEITVRASSKVDDKKYRLLSPEKVTIKLEKNREIIFKYEPIEELPDDIYRHDAYIKGYEDGTVRPENNITREEVAMVIFRLLDKSKVGSFSQSNYLDVESNRWSSEAIGNLAKLDIIKGYEDGSFRPENNITRAEAISMIVRFKGTGFGGSKIGLSDVSGHWAENNIVTGLGTGWVEGYPDGSFKPENNITRAEFITMVNNMLNRKVDRKDILNEQNTYRDLSSDKWYYEAVMEATINHKYTKKDNREVWIK